MPMRVLVKKRSCELMLEDGTGMVCRLFRLSLDEGGGSQQHMSNAVEQNSTKKGTDRDLEILTHSTNVVNVASIYHAVGRCSYVKRSVCSASHTRSTA